MMDAEAAPVATPAVAEQADPMDRVIAAAKAREATTPETAAPPGQSQSATPDAAAKPEKKRRAADIASLADREWKATQAQKAADELAGKYKPLEEALGKRDLVTVLNHLAEKHGVTFADFVAVLEQGKPPEKTPAEIARETAEKIINDRAAADKKARDEAEAKAVDERIAGMRGRIEKMADEGGDRWELTAVAGVAGTAWDVIEAWHKETGKALPLEDALDLVEKKLRDKRDARRPKLEVVKPNGTGAKPSREADASTRDGRAGTPSFNNRSTSGVAGVVGASPDVDIATLPEHEAIDLAIRRANIRL